MVGWIGCCVYMLGENSSSPRNCRRIIPRASFSQDLNTAHEDMLLWLDELSCQSHLSVCRLRRPRGSLPGRHWTRRPRIVDFEGCPGNAVSRCSLVRQVSGLLSRVCLLSLPSPCNRSFLPWLAGNNRSNSIASSKLNSAFLIFSRGSTLLLMNLICSNAWESVASASDLYSSWQSICSYKVVVSSPWLSRHGQ